MLFSPSALSPTCPFLRIRQVSDGVPIGSDEQAAWVLADTKCGVLDLVIVDVAVKANHHSPDLKRNPTSSEKYKQQYLESISSIYIYLVSGHALQLRPLTGPPVFRCYKLTSLS